MVPDLAPARKGKSRLNPADDAIVPELDRLRPEMQPEAARGGNETAPPAGQQGAHFHRLLSRFGGVSCGRHIFA
ncbi:hypothetical protein RA19_22675 [Leisingera sp. ANG-M1]|nr:hypothetical protein RA19_22675 [Leisingera sp. ANG-M1]